MFGYKICTDLNFKELHMPPENYLVQGASDAEQGSVFIYKKPVYSVKTSMIPIFDIAGIDSQFLFLIVKHAETIGEYDVFKNQVLRYVVALKGNTFVKAMLFNDFYLTLLLFVGFLTHSIAFNDYSVENDTSISALGICLMVLCYLLSCYFLYHEICQMIKSWADAGKVHSDSDSEDFVERLKIFMDKLKTLAYEYFFDAWNMIHLTTNTMIIVTLSKQAHLLTTKDINSNETIIMSALIQPFLALEILFYLSGLKSTGSLIRMIIKIIHGNVGVIVILGIMIVSFAGSYTILFQENPQYEYQNFVSSLISVYGHLFANYDVDTFDSSSSPNLAKFQISIFLFLVVIVILNLLIALMSDIYASVQANATAESTFGIAKLIVEYEGLMSYSYKQKNEKSFSHIGFTFWRKFLKRKIWMI